MKLFSENNKVQSLVYWTTYANNHKKLIVFYGEDVLDLTTFAPKHPAGQKAITSYLLQDIKNILFRVYPHPSHAVETLNKYRCGKIKDHKQNLNQQNHYKGICKQKSGLTAKKEQQNKKVSFGVNSPQKQIKKQPDKSKHIQSQRNKKKQKQLTIKIEDNTINFQQNKPALLVPFFNVKLDCFSKQNKFKNQGSLDDSITNTV